MLLDAEIGNDVVDGFSPHFCNLLLKYLESKWEENEFYRKNREKAKNTNAYRDKRVEIPVGFALEKLKKQLGNHVVSCSTDSPSPENVEKDLENARKTLEIFKEN